MRTILHEKEVAIKSIWQPSREKSDIQILIYPQSVWRFKIFVDLFMRTYIVP